ncbi:unnamed protein product [Nippostrongylus brasiliensis]|uniref:Uncharacterized protein n=1 Tax=Nippostrongylus brasiliensis TaxID=27835 RepID=A0A0N4YSS0_NIPBR|nr:unnamed protein product [Nippostrongylus brasiliensis]
MIQLTELNFGQKAVAAYENVESDPRNTVGHSAPCRSAILDYRCAFTKPVQEESMDQRGSHDVLERGVEQLRRHGITLASTPLHVCANDVVDWCDHDRVDEDTDVTNASAVSCSEEQFFSSVVHGV